MTFHDGQGKIRLACRAGVHWYSGLIEFMRKFLPMLYSGQPGFKSWLTLISPKAKHFMNWVLNNHG
jgi:hypothetical protein